MKKTKNDRRKAALQVELTHRRMEQVKDSMELIKNMSTQDIERELESYK